MAQPVFATYQHTYSLHYVLTSPYDEGSIMYLENKISYGGIQMKFGKGRLIVGIELEKRVNQPSSTLCASASPKSETAGNRTCPGPSPSPNP